MSQPLVRPSRLPDPADVTDDLPEWGVGVPRDARWRVELTYERNHQVTPADFAPGSHSPPRKRSSTR